MCEKCQISLAITEMQIESKFKLHLIQPKDLLLRKKITRNFGLCQKNSIGLVFSELLANFITYTHKQYRLLLKILVILQNLIVRLHF